MPTISADDLKAPGLRQRDAAPRLRALLDAAVDAIITIDQHGIIESVNAATERMFGFTAAELIGSNVKVLMPDPHRALHDDYIQRYLMTGERRIIGIGREVEGRHKDGNVFPVDLAVTEFQANGQRMFMGIIRDISDRRAAEHAAQARLDELAHAGRLADLGVTTSTIAHEVNQPLAAIVSFAHACQRMLAGGRADEAVLRDALSQIAEQGERASAIIARIRGMAKKREGHTEQVSVNDAVDGVLGMLSRQLRFEHVNLDVHLDPELPAVRADRVQVEQVIMNLVMNAVDAMREMTPEARRLVIVSARRDDAVILTVRDTGPGLDDKQADRVFESFYSTKSGGMGIGLSICRSLAESHGGRLWAESTPGDGATFHFELPARS